MRRNLVEQEMLWNSISPKFHECYNNYFKRKEKVQYVAQFPATKDVDMYFLPQKTSNQLKLTLKVASVFKEQV